MIKYSFIIPHKNSPLELKRLLDTIPLRDDIQIVVVDDNSEVDKRPIISGRKNAEVVLLSSNSSKGAGRARNVGMEKATGKWLLFADADDMYQVGFVDVLDKELKDEIDILYFDFYNNYNISYSSEEPTRYHKYLTDYNENPYSCFRENRVKYGLSAPWNKVFKCAFVRDHKVLFEEIPAGNDMYFVHTCGALTTNIKCISDKLYYYIKNREGITNKRMTKEAIVNRIVTSSSHIRFIQDQGAWDIGDTSWPSVAEIYQKYGLLFSIKVYILKLRYFRPSLYVHAKHRLMLHKEKMFEQSIHQK